MNTRMFPRTTNEAFQHTADYASSIEKPPSRAAETAVKWALFAGIVAVILSICFQGAV